MWMLRLATSRMILHTWRWARLGCVAPNSSRVRDSNRTVTAGNKIGLDVPVLYSRVSISIVSQHTPDCYKWHPIHEKNARKTVALFHLWIRNKYIECGWELRRVQYAGDSLC